MNGYDVTATALAILAVFGFGTGRNIIGIFSTGFLLWVVAIYAWVSL